MRLSVIGIGSNSVRLLVADVREGELCPVLRDRRGTRLFASLQEGALSGKGRETTLDCVQEMVAEAGKTGPDHLYLFATSAVRDAGNRDIFLEELRRRTGFSTEVISGEEEACLSYWGAAKPGLCGLIDIGGGSTEVTIGQDGTPLVAVSLQMGAVRLHRQYPIQAAADVALVEAAARQIFREGNARLMKAALPDVWVGVGGTFTTLAAMEKGLKSFDRSLIEGVPLNYETARRWACRIADMPLEQRYHLPGLQPQRADIVAHGLAILMALSKEMRIPEVAASDKGNLEGYLRRKLRQQQVDKTWPTR